MNIFKSIELQDKDLFDRYLSLEKQEISELAFTNLYLRHFSRSIQFTEIENCLIVEIKYHNENPFILFPIGLGNKVKALEIVSRYYSDRKIPFVLRYLLKGQIEQLKTSNLKFSIEAERDHFDYVYSVKELITLEGKKYHGKKNWINRFLNKYEYKYQSLYKTNIKDIIDAELRWCMQKNCDVNQALNYEKEGIIETLKVIDVLQCKGGVIIVGDKVVAFTIADLINKDTVSIHIEKADSEYEGAYQVINREFLSNDCSDITYVNREDDIGIEGLRQAKLSYHPISFVEKYICKLIYLS